MIIKYSSLVIFLLMLFLLVFESNWQKVVFCVYYKGMLLYLEVYYEWVVSYFEKVYSIILDNYNFNFFFVLVLSWVGWVDEGLGLL